MHQATRSSLRVAISRKMAPLHCFRIHTSMHLPWRAAHSNRNDRPTTPQVRVAYPLRFWLLQRVGGFTAPTSTPAVIRLCALCVLVSRAKAVRSYLLAFNVVRYSNLVNLTHLL